MASRDNNVKFLLMNASVVKGYLFCFVGGALGAIAAPVAVPAALGAIGFTAGGITAGSMAASAMSAAAAANGGAITAGSAVAVAQSVGAAGLGFVGKSVGAAVGAYIGNSACTENCNNK